MDEKEVLQKVEDITTQFSEHLKKAATKEDMESIKAAAKEETKNLIESVKASITTELQEKIDQQTDILKKQGEALELMKKAPATAPQHPMDRFKNAVRDAIMKSDFVEKYSTEFGDRYRIKGANNKNLAVSIDFTEKSAVDMNTANAVRPGSSPGISIGALTDYGMNPVQLPNTMNQHFIGAGFTVTPTTEKYFGVIKEVTETNGAGIKAEANAAGDSSWLWDSDEYKVFDFAAKFRVHQNTLDDIEGVINRIATLGIDRLLTVIDINSLNSAGDGSTSPYGLRTTNYYTAYNTTLRAATVVKPNIVNVVKNMVLQANNQDFDQDFVVLNRTDVAEIEDLKDENANTVNLAGIKLGNDGKLAYLYGLKVIINNNLTVRTVITGKMAESLQYGERAVIGMRMGYDQTTDFSKKIVTIQLDSRAAIGIGNPLATIYCSDVDAAISALTKA